MVQPRCRVRAQFSVRGEAERPARPIGSCGLGVGLSGPEGETKRTPDRSDRWPATQVPQRLRKAYLWSSGGTLARKTCGAPPGHVRSARSRPRPPVHRFFFRPAHMNILPQASSPGYIVPGQLTWIYC
uniref:Uncharacterized protein n=1 Tax=Leptobrachium leishanense TaxID=445787 RepID=A0A8C5PMS2_9ANUR